MASSQQQNVVVDTLNTHELCDEIATAAFEFERPIYANSSSWPHVSPTGESSAPFTPRKQIECLEFLLKAADGSIALNGATQSAVDRFIDTLHTAKETRNG